MNDIDIGVALMFFWSIAIFLVFVLVISLFTVLWEWLWGKKEDDDES